MIANALKYLQLNPLKHMDMIEPLKRGTAEILYASDDGVCFKETKSGAYMVSALSPEKGRVLSGLIPDGALISFHQAYMLENLKAKFRHFTLLENFQAVYFSNKHLPLLSDIVVKPLDASDFSVIFNNYDIDIGSEYLRERLVEGALFGGYAGGDYGVNNLVGFVGIHAEGSIGLLKVLDEHRKKGYGAALASFAVNHQLKQGIVPFAQIEINNAQSLALMQKLGFEISNEPVYWLWSAAQTHESVC